MTASFALPMLSASEVYTATLPLGDEGLEKAYLPSDFSGQIVFDEDNEKRRTVIDVLAGRFDDEGLLDLDVNVKNEHMKVELKNLNHFKLNGYSNYGFGAIGQHYDLETPQTFLLGDLRFNLLGLRVGKYNQFYGIGFEIQANMGASVSGKDGAAITTIAASKELPTLTGQAAANIPPGTVAPSSLPPPETAAMEDEETKKNLKILKDRAPSDFSGVVEDEKGFAFGMDVRIDVGIGYFYGYLQYQVTEEFGQKMTVLGGGVETDMNYMIGLPVDELKGQAIVGMHIAANGAPKPIILVRCVIGATILSAPPILQFANFGFAVGTFTAPEDFMPDDFTPATEMRWNVDLNTPLAIYLSAKFTDDAKVPGINVGVAGTVYIFTMAGGVRVDASDNIDFDHPSTLSNLQLCGTYSEVREFINAAAIPIVGPIANKFIKEFGGITPSAVYLALGADICLGKVTQARGKGLVMGLSMPVPGLILCSRVPAWTTFRIDWSNLNDPTKYELTQTFGTRDKPFENYLLCNPALKMAVNLWTSSGMKDGAFFTKTGIAVGLYSKIAIGLNLGFAAATANFDLKAELSAEGTLALDLSSFSQESKANHNKEEVKFLVALNVRAEFLAHAFVKYKFGFLNVDKTITLGYVYLLADGVIRAQQDGIFLDGTYEATFRALNSQFTVRDSQTLELI